jgi:hypothetical protein
MGIEKVSIRKQGVRILSQHFTAVKAPRSLGRPLDFQWIRWRPPLPPQEV